MPRTKNSNQNASASKAQKRSGGSRRTPSAAPTAEAVVSAPAPVQVEATPVENERVDVVATPAETTQSSTLTGDFTTFMTRLQQVSSMLSSLKTEFRTLEKKATRELRVAQKVSAKRKRKAGNRNPSGFVKPTLISNELAAFLGKTNGTEMARTEVTREINAYIREHKLQDSANGRRINADSKLSGLLKLKKGDELTYFNLQKYMSPHFAKTVKAETA